jgi:hypothetical protein
MHALPKAMLQDFYPEETRRKKFPLTSEREGRNVKADVKLRKL